MKPLVFGATSTNSLTESVQSLGVWLNALAVVQRPTRFVHIGIGDGKGESSAWTQWSFTKALAIDAEPINADVLNINPQSQAFIDLRSNVVIADTEDRVSYFVANNPYENGLIDPSLLRMIWPSLTLSHQTQRDATTLDRAAADILNVSKDANAEPLWLIIDALPGGRILSGGAKLLEASSLVCVRALAEAGFRGEPVGADLAAVDLFLEGKGFTRVIYLPGLNPKIGHALYARKQVFVVTNPAEIEALQEQTQAKEIALHQLAEAKQTAEALTVSLQLSSENRQTLQVKLDATLHERDIALAASATLNSQLQEQTQAKEAALHQLTQTNQSAEVLKVNLEQSIQNRQALQAQLEVALHERDAGQANSAALGAQLQEQTEAKEVALHQLTQANQSSEALTASLEKSTQNLKALQAQLDATVHERDAVQANSAALSAQLQEQTQAKEEALHQLAQANQSSEALTASLEKSTQNLQALQAQLDATVHERDAVQANSAALSVQLQEQTQSKEAALHQLAHANQSKEAALQQLSDMQQSFDTVTAKLKATETAIELELGQVQRLSAENQELSHRQQLMNEELVKAEGQISLIKDLLLREQGI
jgi:hypothetical protein